VSRPFGGAALKRVALLVAAVVALWPGGGARALGLAFAPGDVFVSLENGPVQWYAADGTLNRVLVSTVGGTGEGMGFDPAGNLYVTRWCMDPWCRYTGDTVEEYNTLGQSLGRVGSGYNCAPHAILFDGPGNAYVGQAGCSGAILKFAPGMTMPVAYAVAPDNQGSFWIDLAADQCTVMYTSYGPNVKQFDLCAGIQLPNFNVAPLPGGAAQDLRILPDGGVIVSSGQVIARLDAAGILAGSYSIAGEPGFWAGLDLVGDGTFWAGNYETSNVYRFDLATGGVVTGFNAHTPTHTVVGVRVKK
jgi:outer membrane protein assembly factor BamB